MNIKDILAGTAVLVIGGATYTINQADVVANFASSTGLSQQEAEQYVTQISEDDLVSFNEIGTTHIEEGQDLLKVAADIDCFNYEYEWESLSLTCETGKAQLQELGKDSIALGHAYEKIGSESASETDIATTISLLSEVNSDYEFTMVENALDPASIDETKKTNSYNKAVLQAALTGK